MDSSALRPPFFVNMKNPKKKAPAVSTSRPTRNGVTIFFTWGDSVDVRPGGL
jgi:hypothetical protein